MIKEDALLKIVDKEKQVRITIASTRGVVEEARRRHHTSATASAALGRVLTAALIMGSDLKAKEDILTLKVDGKGPAGNIIATVNSQGQVRGLISNPQADLPARHPGKLAVGELVGNDGYLEVIKDLGLKQPFIGRTDLISGEIAEDLSHYYLMSEQIPSLVALGILVAPDLSIQTAGGIIVQALPGASDQLLEKIENNILNIGSISHALKDENTLKELLKRVMEGVEYEIVGALPVQFKCTCSHERLAGILTTLSDQDIADLCHTGEEIEVCCNFCNEKYNFKADEIMSLKSEKP